MTDCRKGHHLKKNSGTRSDGAKELEDIACKFTTVTCITTLGKCLEFVVSI
jgi:hypothetical protein